MNKIDETGNKYGRLTVLSPANSINNRATWLCECECGNKCVVMGKYLRNGDTKSCGCLATDTIRNIGKDNQKRNRIEIENDIVKVFFNNAQGYFICDIDDIQIAQSHTWHKTKNGYARCGTGTKGNSSFKFFHNYIIPVEKDNLCDHINGNRLDNRRCNLRSVTKQQNSLNRGIYINNTSGHTGVSKSHGKWVAYIDYQNQHKSIGSFLTYKEAVEAREREEIFLFKEYRRAAGE